jgi:hypothetical protein
MNQWIKKPTYSENNKVETPRTEAEYKFKWKISENPCEPNEHSEWMSSLCRSLETECVDLRVEVADLHQECKKYRLALNRIAHPKEYGLDDGHHNEIAKRALVIGVYVNPLPSYLQSKVDKNKLWSCPHCQGDDYVDTPDGRFCFYCEQKVNAKDNQQVPLSDSSAG